MISEVMLFQEFVVIASISGDSAQGDTPQTTGATTKNTTRTAPTAA